MGKYKDQRDHLDADTTSRLSPYLAAGIISARACIREALVASGKKKVDTSRDTGIGRWIQEIGEPALCEPQGLISGLRLCPQCGAISTAILWRSSRECPWAVRSWRSTQTSDGRRTKSTSRHGRMAGRVCLSLTRPCVRRTRWGGSTTGDG